MGTHTRLLIPLLFFLMMGTTQAQVVERVVGSGTVSLFVQGEGVYGLIVTEQLPEGWEFLRATPEPQKLEDKELVWVLYEKLGVGDEVLVYEVVQGAGLPEGAWTSVDGEGKKKQGHVRSRDVFTGFVIGNASVLVGVGVVAVISFWWLRWRKNRKYNSVILGSNKES